MPQPRYTTADLHAVFEECRALVTVHAGHDPNAVDYLFRMDAMIRWWLLEMGKYGGHDHEVLRALKAALRWAGWQATCEVFSDQVH